MSNMFCGCWKLEELDLSNFDTSNVIDMHWMFSECYNLKTLDISNFDTSNVTNMACLFNGCHELTDIDISNFNTENVTNMENMFTACLKTKILDLSNFDTNNVDDMYNIFKWTTNLETLILGPEWQFLEDNGLNKSWKKDGDDAIYTAAQLTSSYDGTNMSGTYRAFIQLTITEQVKGTVADINKNFNFTIEVLKEGIGINSTLAYTGTKSGNLVFSNGIATFTLKHNDIINVYIPGINDYTITQNNDGYTLVKTNDTGTLDDNITASFTDTLNGTTPTGIFLDLLPFIILIIFGVLGIFLIKGFKYI